MEGDFVGIVGDLVIVFMVVIGDFGAVVERVDCVEC